MTKEQRNSWGLLRLLVIFVLLTSVGFVLGLDVGFVLGLESAKSISAENAVAIGVDHEVPRVGIEEATEICSSYDAGFNCQWYDVENLCKKLGFKTSFGSFQRFSDNFECFDNIRDPIVNVYAVIVDR